MWQLIISILGILITIFFVIGTHEAAHFLAARLLGVKVLRFSIGFGKALWRWHDRSGTEYVVALIPLGGYVKMLDEREDPVPANQLARAYNRQPLFKKFLIVLAGPLMNLFCAFVLYWIIFVIGFTTFKPIIGTVTSQSIAAEGGLQANQEIIAIDHEPTPTWTKVIFRLLAHAGDADRLTVESQDMQSKQKHTAILDLSNWHVHGLTPDPLASLGITPYQPQVPLSIGFIAPDSPAAQSQLKIGDKILTINGQTIHNWEQAINLISTHPQQLTTFKVRRNKKIISVPLNIGEQRRGFYQKIGYAGIGPAFSLPSHLLKQIKYQPWAAFKPALEEVINLSYFNLLLFKKLLTGKLSLETLGGPITIFEGAGNSLNYGFIPFVGFLAFLSVSIGIINLFPIPGLDGGHLIIQFLETIIKRPLSEMVLINLYRIGFLILFFVLIQALVNDILRLY